MARSTRRQFMQQTAMAAAALYGRPLAAFAGELQKTRGNGQGALDAATLRKLASQIGGQVIVPQDPAYDSARVVFNRAFNEHPAVIVRCANTTDVQRVLEFSQTQNLPLAVRGGGHSRAGFGVCDGGVVMDMSAMNHVEVDSAKRVAKAQAGALVRDMDKATQQVGLATTMGGCPTVGVAGLTLGGGEGLLMSKYGAACDNLLSAQVVTVDGRQLDASERSNPDLFWAIRGGGGNFGVVTALEYRLYPMTNVLAGVLTYPPGRVVELLQAFGKFVAAAPDEMNVVGVVSPSERGPQFSILVCHCGEAEKGNRLLEPLRALKPQQDTIKVASYLETQSTINPYSPVAHFQTNVFLPELSPGAIAAVADATSNAPSTRRAFIVPLYGAISRVPASDTAFPLRQPGYEIDLMGRWTDAAEKASAVQWVQELRDKLQPYAHGVYSNQLGETSVALVTAAYGSNYSRLQEIKKKYDPNNVLRINQNVKPA